MYLQNALRPLSIRAGLRQTVKWGRVTAKTLLLCLPQLSNTTPRLGAEQRGNVTLPLQTVSQALPMRTEKKNWDTGMFKMGAERFRNQFGVMGNSLRNNKKKNKQLLFSSTCQEKRSKLFLLFRQQ